jgi:hypothetical protein
LIDKLCELFFKDYFSERLLKDDSENDSKNNSSDISDNNAEYSVSSSGDFLKQEIDLYDSNNKEEKINVSKRTLTTRLYVIEQEIEIFRFEFPDEFAKFKEEIKCIKNNYDSSAEEIKKDMTFEIDPEIDSKKIMEINHLEKRVKRFINNDVKFYILSQKLQRLAVKLNILYNVSISHFTKNDKEKVISQIERAIPRENLIVQDFKESDFILNNLRFKERIVTLISFVDYEILKICIRNSEKSPKELIYSLVSINEFTDFNYYDSFKAFVLDEISDIGELLEDSKRNEYDKSLKKRCSRLLEILTFSDSEKETLFENEFWDEFLSIESNVIESLKLDGVSKDIARVKILDRMDIQVNESEVLTSPKTNVYLALTNAFSKNRDIKILILIKLFNNLTEKITYKEIYFLMLLFNSLDEITKMPVSVSGHLEKYIKKYPYNTKTINNKKAILKQSSNKKYIYVFTLDDNRDEIINTLHSLDIDFNVVDNDVFMNTFYFNDLENVINSLQSHTINSTT